MADNLGYTPGSPASVATDDVAGVHYQRVKLDIGGNGATVPVEGSVPSWPQDRTVAGTLGALNDAVTVDPTGAVGVVFVAHSGTLTGTITFEWSPDDGATWFPARLLQSWTGGATASTADGADFIEGSWAYFPAGPNLVDDIYASRVRARVSAYTSDSVDVRAIPLANAILSQDGIPSTRLVTADMTALFVEFNEGDGHTAGHRLEVSNLGRVYNGSAWDRLRGDTLGLHISRQATAATATVTSVAGSASSVTILALNTARKGATIYNDSTAILYVKLGTTASTTSFTAELFSDDYFEVPFGYTGRIDGIWASAAGNARITELT